MWKDSYFALEDWSGLIYFWGSSKETWKYIFEGDTRKILIRFFWVKTPCGLVGGSQRFEKSWAFHLQ
jgi:hypothetical protein